MNTVINAVYQYAIDKNGLPSTIVTGTGSSAREICKVTYMPTGNECVNLRMLSGVYLVGIPVDPTKAPTNTGYTGYKMWKDTNNRVNVSAPLAEQTPGGILVTR